MSASLRPESERTPLWIPDCVNRLVNAMETRSFKSNQMKNYFDNIKRYRAFSVKYRPATNFRSSRITIYDERLGERVTIPYDHRYDSPWEIAVTYLLNLPHPIQIESLGMSKDDSHVLLTTDFSTSMKQAEKRQAKNRLVNMDGTTEEFDGEY